MYAVLDNLHTSPVASNACLIWLSIETTIRVVAVVTTSEIVTLIVHKGLHGLNFS